jgi:ATP phosphoribosyltransferase regulatory subunit
MAGKTRYPTGVRPLLIEEAARRRRIESRFVGQLERAGFAEVVLPIIDYAEPYAAIVPAAASRQSYRFIDREGDLVAIRSDFTPMIARALAPAITERDLPLRVFYRGDVIRCEASRLGTNRELFQIGAEIIGDPSAEADITALTFAAEMAREFGIGPLVVYNDSAIVSRLVAEYGPDVRESLVTKRANRAPNALVEKLARGTATIDDVAAWAPVADRAERLKKIGSALDPATFTLHLDDVDDKSDYYTGIRFRVFDAASRARIAQGGRYDDLYARFGTDAAAIGFTFTVDDLNEVNA